MSANALQSKLEAEHSAKNAFVKAQEMKLAKMGAKAPNLTGEYMNFDSCMVSDGMHAQEFAREATKGLDKDAFPVK